MGVVVTEPVWGQKYPACLQPDVPSGPENCDVSDLVEELGPAAVVAFAYSCALGGPLEEVPGLCDVPEGRLIVSAAGELPGGWPEALHRPLGNH